MAVLIERTSKTLKLLRAIGLTGLYLGGFLYVVKDSGWGLALVLCSVLLLGLTKLLTWWFHA